MALTVGAAHRYIRNLSALGVAAMGEIYRPRHAKLGRGWVYR
jgi:hypothetical protein